MDAVVFMEAINKPQTPATPPPPSGGKPRGLSANTSLIAGIATLVLAIGVGVLIGQSGDNGTSSVANQTPQIIRVGGGGGGEEEAAASEEEAGKKNNAGGKEKGKSKNPNAKKAEKKAETGSTGQTKATEEVLEPKVPQAKPEAQLGETCDKGTAGCSDSGKFEGNFFGE